MVSSTLCAPLLHQIYASGRGADFCHSQSDAKLVVRGSALWLVAHYLGRTAPLASYESAVCVLEHPLYLTIFQRCTSHILHIAPDAWLELAA